MQLALLEGTYTMNLFPSADSQLNAADSSPLPPIERSPKESIAHAAFSSSWRIKAIVAMMVCIGLGLAGVLSAAPQNVASGTIEFSVDLWPPALDTRGVGEHSPSRAKNIPW